MRIADLPLHLLCSIVDFDPKAQRTQPVRHLMGVLVLRVGDRNHDYLHRVQPRGKGARVVLDQECRHALERTERPPMDHHRSLS